MKFLKLNEKILNDYLIYSNTKEKNLIKDGSFDKNNLNVLKKEILDLQENYISNEGAEVINNLPPLEWHPYDLEENNLNLNSKILLLGTFPPPSYLIEKYAWYDNNKLKSIRIGSIPDIPYFYGNMSSLWNILNIDLTEYKSGNEKKVKIIKELKEKKIHIDDIILACQRKVWNDDRRSADSNLCNIVPNYHIIDNLLDFNNLNRIIFTSANWDLQKKGNIADNSSTMGIFLKILKDFYQVRLCLKDNWYCLNQLSENKLKQELFLKYKKKSKKQNIEFSDELGYKAPNFLKIEIKKNSKSKELILIGLPSPSGTLEKNIENTIYFKLWKKYNESKNKDCDKNHYRRDLYKLGFSTDDKDIETLFNIQSVDISS